MVTSYSVTSDSVAGEKNTTCYKWCNLPKLKGDFEKNLNGEHQQLFIYLVNL